MKFTAILFVIIVALVMLSLAATTPPVAPKYADFTALAAAIQKGELDGHYFIQIEPDGRGCRLRYRNAAMRDGNVDLKNAECRTLFVYIPPPPDIAGQLDALSIPYRRSSLPDDSISAK